MYIVPKPQNKLYIYSWNGNVFGPYHSIEDMVTYLDPFTARAFGYKFEEPFDKKIYLSEVQFIAKDSHHNIVDPKDILDAYKKHRLEIRENNKRFKFRDGPVPKTGKPKKNRQTKIISQISERKDLESHQEDETKYKIKIRAKRKNLKTNRDYKIIPEHKNWKKFRKHQWKTS